MKVLLDLQSAQTGRTPGERADHPACRLAQALLAAANNNIEIHLLLASTFPEAVEQLRTLFAPSLPTERMHLLTAPVPEAAWERQTASLLYETLVDNIAPDVIHYADPFSGNADQPVTPPLCNNLQRVATATVDSPPPPSPTFGGKRHLQTALALKRVDLTCCLSAEAMHCLTTHFFLFEEQLLSVPPQDEGQLANILLEQWPTLLQQKHTERLYRPSLAYLSPLPPEQSGIADYSAELIPELSRYYEITLISDLPVITDHRLADLFPVRSTAWFEQNSDKFDRIVYHIGNSHFHERQFSLLPRHPGTVVLHDCFLSNIVDALGRASGDPGALTRRIYLDHGYTPLLASSGQEPAYLADQYPCSLQIIRQSAGVIVHSAFSAHILQHHYGHTVTPLVQQVPFLRLPVALPSRVEARQQLGIPLDAFVVCSFGFVGPTKLSHRLLAAWQGSALAQDARCRLIYVGGNHPGSYGDDLQHAIDQAVNPGSVAVTGFVNSWKYQCYLAAADLAVQLRTKSRGETSAAVYDCLMAGLPLICNAHGSMAELPDSVVFKLPEQFEDAALQQQLEQLWQTPLMGTEWSEQATLWLKQQHFPPIVAGEYQRAIEHFHHIAPRNHERHLLKHWGATTTEQQMVLAANLATNNRPPGLPQLLLDISAVAWHDLKTGIERVVRSLLHELLHHPPACYRVEPVYHNAQGGYSYAHRFTMRSLGYDDPLLEDTPVQAYPGDHFLGADLILAAIPQVTDCLQDWRTRGVIINFIVYDLLPLQRPDCFPPHIEPSYRLWLETVVAIADRLACISQAVADELREYLEREPITRNPILQISHFHLGADIDASLPTLGLPDDALQLLQQLSARSTFLMVSTIEPRKGHAQALDAFELLWQQGTEANLVIVGKPGWMTEKLIERLDSHPERGGRLFCLYNATDELLQLIYKNSACLLAASEGEGFGLPLIEGAQHGLPLIVRDIPVFREIAGCHATYFSGSRAADLANVVKNWLEMPDEKRPSSTGLSWLTWQQSVRRLLEVLTISPAKLDEPNLITTATPPTAAP